MQRICGGDLDLAAQFILEHAQAYATVITRASGQCCAARSGPRAAFACWDVDCLDNFDLDLRRAAVTLDAGHAKLEASGGIFLGDVRENADTGVNRISIGELAKDVKNVNLSMRFA